MPKGDFPDVYSPTAVVRLRPLSRVLAAPFFQFEPPRVDKIRVTSSGGLLPFEFAGQSYFETEPGGQPAAKSYGVKPGNIFRRAVADGTVLSSGSSFPSEVHPPFVVRVAIICVQKGSILLQQFPANYNYLNNKIIYQRPGIAAYTTSLWSEGAPRFPSCTSYRCSQPSTASCASALPSTPSGGRRLVPCCAQRGPIAFRSHRA